MTYRNAMVAFYPPPAVTKMLTAAVAEAGVVAETIPADEMHVTVMDLGELDLISEKRDAIIEALRNYAAQMEPVVGYISGSETFYETHRAGVSCTYAAVTSPDLQPFYEGLVPVLATAGIPVELKHDYTPHITLFYYPQEIIFQYVRVKATPFQFHEVVLTWGDERMTIPIGTAPVAEEDEPVSLVEGGHIKALNDENSRIGGYLVRWGTPIEKDLQGEFFTKNTDFALHYYGGTKRPALYHHARDPHVKGVAIGLIDTIRSDDTGLWAEAELEKNNRYFKAIKELLAKGKLFWSSGTIPGVPTKAANGEILYWPLVEGSLTPTPVEFRNTNVYNVDPAQAVSIYKSLDLPTDIFDLLQDRTSGSGKDTGGSADAVGGKAVVGGTPIIPIAEDEPMTQEEMTKQMDEAVTKALSAQLPAIVEVILNKQKMLTPVEAPVTPPTTPAAAPSKSLPAAPVTPDTRIEITRATKYSDMSAEDMSYLATISPHAKATKGLRDSEAFIRELADKSLRDFAKGNAPVSSVKGLLDMGIDSYQKANELSHSTQSSYGDEWVADHWSNTLWEKVRAENVIAPLFNVIEMPTDPFEIPIEATDPTVLNFAETTGQTSLSLTAGTVTKIGSSKVQLDAGKIGYRAVWSNELQEDAIIALVPHYRKQGVRALMDAVDNVLMNGDNDLTASTNINLIDGTPGGTEKYTVFDGIRLYCLVTNTAQKKDAGGTPTLQLLRETRFKMAISKALRPKDCAWLVDASTYQALLNLDEFLTMDKAGAMATNMTGQIGILDGVPVFASAEMALANSAGKIPNAGGTLGQAVIVFRPNWVVGYRRRVEATVEKIVGVDAFVMSVYARLALGSFDTTSAAELYNITV